MHNRTIAVAVGLFIIIIVGMFIFAYLKRGEIKEQLPPPQVEAPVAGPYDYIDRIDAVHFYIDGVHTLVGEVMLPTPCDLLNWDTSMAESMPESVTVGFDVINNDREACAQVMTPARFKVSFTASENAEISATLNGRPLILNLIPPKPGETPEEYELFIKG